MPKNEADAAKAKLEKLARLLEREIASNDGSRRYPDQALPAIHDDKLQKVLVEELSGDNQVTGIYELGYEQLLEVTYILFAISNDPMRDTRSGVLCLVDAYCGVMGLRAKFTVPEKSQPVGLPTARPPASNPFVLTQQLQSAPLLFGHPRSGDENGSSSARSGAPINLDSPFSPIGGNPLIPDRDWPPAHGRIPTEDVFDGKNQTNCTVCKTVWCFLPTPPGGGVNVQDDTVCMSEADDCGDQGLFSSALSFSF